MTLAPSDAHQRTIEYGVRALAEVKRHGTSAEPIAYELWYSHVSGQHRKLSAELKERLGRGRLSERDIEELHGSYLSSLRVSDALEAVGAKARGELQDVLEAVRSSLGDMAGFDGDLQAIARRLEGPALDGGSLRAVLSALVGTTKRICDANQALQGRLESSESNMAALQIALEATRGEALTDALTGLANRRAFDEQLEARRRTAAASGTPLSLLMLDIDHFKSFNDTHGHPVGDQVIRLVGSCIKGLLGAGDFPARYGGEEFAIVTLGRPVPEAVRVAEEIRRKIASYEIVQQGTKRSLGKITVSAGAAGLRPGDTAERLLERADGRLYAAKRAGRNRVEAEGA